MTKASAVPSRYLVLLSTHNGTRFLSQQVASVLAQREVEVRLHIRDDGSTDGTVSMLRGLAADDPRISYEVGQRLGPARSYLTMLAGTSGAEDYVALCDQDDVWVDGKLARAATWLSPVSGPAAYCSAVAVVDENLRPLGVHRTSLRGPSLENALVQNIATGCTIVLNVAALHFFRQVPLHPVMHDAWIYAVVSAAGLVLYDPDTWVLYRQHGTNSIGLAASQTGQWARRLRQHVVSGRDRVHTRQATELLETLGPELTPTARSTISRFVQAQTSTAGRISYALTGPAFRQRRLDSIVYRVCSPWAASDHDLPVFSRNAA